MDCIRFAETVELLHLRQDKKKELRAFGRQYEKLCSHPLALLKRYHRLGRKDVSFRWANDLRKWLFRFSFVLYVLSFFFGFFSALAVLHYNGKEPVNIVYFLFVGVVLPVITLVLSSLAVLKASSTYNPFLHMTLTYLIEKWSLKKSFDGLKEILRFERRLLDWVVLIRMQMAGLWFAIGMLTGLLLSVASQDIAFVWSTTLAITPSTLHGWIEAFSWPWHRFWPDAVPSLSLIEHSRYFRLGGRIDASLTAHASELGKWWQFLAATLLCYVLLPRSVVYLWAKWKISKLLNLSLIRIGKEATDTMCRPLSRVKTDKQESPRLYPEAKRICTKKLEPSYGAVVVLGLSDKDANDYRERYGIEAKKSIYLGGNRPFQEDMETVKRIKGYVLVLVRGWEPPTFDTMDLIEALLRQTSRVDILLAGLSDENYLPTQEELTAWEMRLSDIKEDQLCLVTL